jgi:hypothetical protein
VKQEIEMSAARITVEGESIEVAGRFTSEAEIDAFSERLWGIFFALHPEAAEQCAAQDAPKAESAKPVDLPQLPRPSAVMTGLDPAIHESSVSEEQAVDARHNAGHDAEREASASGRKGESGAPRESSREDVSDDAAAVARLNASERRAVLLMRKHGDRNAVAREMEINPNSVTNLLGYARRKGVQI